MLSVWLTGTTGLETCRYFGRRATSRHSRLSIPFFEFIPGARAVRRVYNVMERFRVWLGSGSEAIISQEEGK